jgi:hypothetical protein
MKRKHPELPDRYDAFLQELKERIRSAQVRAALSINRELVLLYWGIGGDILDRQKSEGWGAKVVDRLARDLLQAFPGMTGFGARNLKYMRAFAERIPSSNLCNRSLHNCPGDTMFGFSKWSKPRRNGNGISGRLSRVAGRGTSLSIRLRVTFTAGRAGRSRTFSERSRLRNQNWLRNS